MNDDRTIDAFITILELEDKIVQYLPVIEAILDCPKDKEMLIAKNELLRGQTRERKYKEKILDIYEKIYFDTQNEKCTNFTKAFIKNIILYIINNFTYEKTNADMYNFISQKKGQCWHFAHFFADLFDLLGEQDVEIDIIKGYAKGEKHLWNRIRFYDDNDEEYYFDLTWIIYDIEKEGKQKAIEKWAFKDEEDFRKDHIEEFVVGKLWYFM